MGTHSEDTWLLVQLLVNVASTFSNCCATHLFGRLYRATKAASLLGLLLLSASEFLFDASHLLFTAVNLATGLCQGSGSQDNATTAVEATESAAVVNSSEAGKWDSRMWLCVAVFAPSNACLFVRNWWITCFTVVRCIVILWPFTARTVFTKSVYLRCYGLCLLLGAGFTGLRVWAAFAVSPAALKLAVVVQAPLPSALVFLASAVMATDLVRLRCRGQRASTTDWSAGHGSQHHQHQHPTRLLLIRRCQASSPPVGIEVDRSRRHSNSIATGSSLRMRHRSGGFGGGGGGGGGGGASSNRVVKATITIVTVAILFVVMETPCSVFVLLGENSAFTEHLSNLLIGTDSLLNFAVFLVTSCTFRKQFLAMFRRG